MATAKPSSSINKKPGSQVVAINLAVYEQPKVFERSGRKWVEYGEKNAYYDYLIDLYNSSAIHSAVIKGTTDLIYGEGIEEGKFGNEDLRRLAFDFYALGNGAVNVIWDKKGETVMDVIHLPVQNVRPAKMDERGKINSYYVCADWSNTSKNKPVEYPKFHKPVINADPSMLSQIAYLKPYKAGYDYFSPVDYQGSMAYIELDKEIANFHLNNLKNGLMPTVAVNFNNGVPDEETQRMYERKLKEKFTGSASSTFLLMFNEAGAEATTFDVLPVSDADKQYQFLSEEVSKKVLAGHRVVSPLLFGIRGGNGFGSNSDEIKQSFLLYEEMVIIPKQRQIEDFINSILVDESIKIQQSRPEAWFGGDTTRSGGSGPEAPGE